MGGRVILMKIDVLTSSRRILYFLAKTGEASIRNTVEAAGSKSKDHMAVYPLALLVEAGFLGLTFEPALTPGAEAKMREDGVARILHVLMIDPDDDGITRYEKIQSWGSMNADTERAYLKSGGYVYLIEIEKQKRERFLAFCIGLVTSSLIYSVTDVVIGNVLIELLTKE
jgi:hypothetical protein